MSSSEAERALAQELVWLKLPAPRREFLFAPPRKWRFDFAWPDRFIALEVEGGGWTNGRHTRGAGFARDMEKYNEAALRGWLVLRVTPEQITSGEAIAWLERALAFRPDDREANSPHGVSLSPTTHATIQAPDSSPPVGRRRGG